MNVTAKLKYQFDVTAREFSLIRRALEKFGPAGSELVRELVERQGKALVQVQEHFDATMKIETKEKNE